MAETGSVLRVEYGQEMSSTEKTIGNFLYRPYVHLAIIIVILIILFFLASKAGFDLWLLNKIGLERLVSERGEPDFWQIGNELAAYKESQVAPMRAEASSDSAGLSEGQAPAATGTAEYMWNASRGGPVRRGPPAKEMLYSAPAARRGTSKREYITGNMGRVDNARLMAILT